MVFGTLQKDSHCQAALMCPLPMGAPGFPFLHAAGWCHAFPGPSKRLFLALPLNASELALFSTRNKAFQQADKTQQPLSNHGQTRHDPWYRIFLQYYRRKLSRFEKFVISATGVKVATHNFTIFRFLQRCSCKLKHVLYLVFRIIQLKRGEGEDLQV